jgi:hypothetical protein
MTKVGVGYSTKRRSGEAAGEAVRAALAGLEGSKPDVLLVFANPGYDQTSLLAAILEIAGRDTLICGCSSEGIIYRDGCNEQACAVNVMAIASDRLSFHAFNVAGFSKDPRACGAAIARKLGELGPDRAKAAFLFPDGLTGNATEMLRSLDAELPFALPIAGGAAGAILRREADRPHVTHQYLNETATSDSISVLVAGGPLIVDVAVSHGCMPLGLPRTVTDADGGWLREIDGLPAWDVLREYVDGSPTDLLGADIIHLCVGEPLDPALREEYGSDYLIRTPLKLGEDKRSLFFPGGLQLGNKLQFTRRDPERVAANAEQSAQALARRHPGQTPIAVFQFDCAGRGYMLFGENTAGAAVRPLQKAFAGNPPWIGFHTFGEIARIGRTPFYHNYTVVLCALYEA